LEFRAGFRAVTGATAEVVVTTLELAFEGASTVVAVVAAAAIERLSPSPLIAAVAHDETNVGVVIAATLCVGVVFELDFSSSSCCAFCVRGLRASSCTLKAVGAT
jgi:hypothetical protein